MQHNNARGRKWVFTLNNYTEAEEIAIANAVEEGTLSYVIFGYETGAEGTPHLQGYAEFPKKVRFSTVKSVFPRAHVEKSKAKNSDQAINYCKKDGKWIEKGTKLVQGKRTDLDDIRLDIIKGKSERDIADEYFSKWVVYRRSFAEYRRLLDKPRSTKSIVHVLWGATGVGKTRIVHDLYQPEDIWTYGGGNWYDGYTGQRVALFDDFRGSEDGIPIGLFLRLLDRYPLRVPVKGSFTNWKPNIIYITSNIRPNDWFPELAFDAFQAFKRRLTNVEWITESIY